LKRESSTGLGMALVVSASTPLIPLAEQLTAGYPGTTVSVVSAR